MSFGGNQNEEDRILDEEARRSNELLVQRFSQLRVAKQQEQTEQERAQSAQRNSDDEKARSEAPPHGREPPLREQSPESFYKSRPLKRNEYLSVHQMEIIAQNANRQDQANESQSSEEAIRRQLMKMDAEERELERLRRRMQMKRQQLEHRLGLGNLPLGGDDGPGFADDHRQDYDFRQPPPQQQQQQQPPQQNQQPNTTDIFSALMANSGDRPVHVNFGSMQNCLLGNVPFGSAPSADHVNTMNSSSILGGQQGTRPQGHVHGFGQPPRPPQHPGYQNHVQRPQGGGFDANGPNQSQFQPVRRDYPGVSVPGPQDPGQQGQYGGFGSWNNRVPPNGGRGFNF